MKKLKSITFIFILIFGSNITFSQQWEKVFDLDRYTKIQDIKSTSDNGIIIGADAGIDYCMAPFIFKLDSTGNIEWLIGYYGIGTEKIFINEENQILFSGFNFGIDDVAGDDYISLSKITAEGDFIFNDTLIELRNDTFEFHPIGLTEFPNRDLLIYSVNRLIKTDSMGKIIWNKYFGNVKPIRNLQIVSSSRFIISNSNGLYKTDDSGVVLDSLYKSHNTGLFISDTIYIADKQKIYSSDTNLIIKSSFDLSDRFSNIHQLFSHDSSIWAKGISLDGNILIIKFTNSFLPIDTFRIPSEKIDTSALLSVSDTKFFLVADRFGQCATACFNQKSFSLNNKITDIIPEKLSIDNIRLDYRDFGDQIRQVGFKFDAQVTIKNKGTEPIKNLAVFSIQSGFMNCAINYNYQKYDSLDILPNQTVDLKFNKIYEMSSLNNINYHYCLSVLAPNSVIETEISNNIICGDFFITGVKETEDMKSSMLIFPNPFKDKIYIQSDNDMMYNSNPPIFQLCDITGKIIITEPVYSIRQQINLSELENGFYVGVIQTGKLKLFYKMIKD